MVGGVLIPAPIVVGVVVVVMVGRWFALPIVKDDNLVYAEDG